MASDSNLRKAGRTATGSLLAATICAVLLFASASTVRAHNVGESYLYLQIYEETLTGRFEVALKDLNPGLGLTGTAGAITPDNLDARLPFLQQYYRDHVSIFQDGRPLTIRFTDHRILNAHGGYALLSFDLGGLEGLPSALTFEYSVLFGEEPGHRGFLLVEHNWSTGTFANENQISLVFSPTNSRQTFDLTTSGKMRGFLAVVRLGMNHILGGIDHILFLIALLVPAVLRREDGRWKPVERLGPALLNVVKIVTAFAVAHSVTLGLAALGVVRLPGALVELIIAVSIAVVAAHLLIPIFQGRLWLIAAGFGLFHGFGFAAALPKMGILEEHVGLALFGFTLGVEIGQIVIVAVLVPILFLARRLPIYRKLFLPAAAAFMILVSTVWIIERGFGVDIPMRELLPPALQKVIP